jgi:hypothetical protein
LVAQVGLHLFPQRLVDVVSDLALVLGIYEAGQFGRGNRNLPFGAGRIGELHYLVGSAV